MEDADGWSIGLGWPVVNEKSLTMRLVKKGCNPRSATQNYFYFFPRLCSPDLNSGMPLMIRRHNLPKVALLLFVAAFMYTDRIRAEQLFNFVADDSGLVLATLQLNALPTSVANDFGTLTFTAAGDDVFGFGVGEYQGDFEQVFVPSGGGPDPTPVADIVDGELVSLSQTISDFSSAIFITDLNPPASAATAAAGRSFDLQIAIASPDPLTSSSISLIDFNAAIPFLVGVAGAFVPVPEPGSASMLLCGCGLVTLRRKKTE